jgi:hypothetical protein
VQTITIEKKPYEPINGQPRYELNQIGKDVAEHEGIKWVWINCPHCGSNAKFYPIFYTKVKSGDDQFGFIIDHHYICKCDYCEDVIYVKFWEVDFDPDWTFQYETHYPIVSATSDGNIPHIVDVSFREAGKCLNAAASIATLVMCRRTIEAVVKDQGSSNNSNLVSAIKDLVSKKTLPPSMGALADLVRVVGNIGAHATDQEIEYAQAREMYGLTKAMVESLYVTPHRVNSIRERIEKEREDRARTAAERTVKSALDNGGAPGSAPAGPPSAG